MLGITTTNARVGGFRGLGKIGKLILAYFARVIAAGGVTEGKECLSNSLSSLDSKQLLDNASLVLIPSGYKESVLFSQVPTSGLGDLDVVRATTATRVNSAGLIEVVASNFPRLDYTNASCPSLLVEPQRTNLALYSNDFSNTVWVKNGCTTTPNTTVSPDGNTNASTLTFTGVNQFIAQTCLTVGTNATGSFYLKGTNGQTIQISVGGVDFLVTLTGNWQRFTLNRPTTTAATINVNTFGSATARVLQIYGFQAEVGSYATSYIPTVASTVTRNADVISKTGISSLIGQTEGVFYAEINGFLGENTARLLSIFNTSLGTYRNYINISLRNLTNLLRFTIAANGVTIRDFSATVVQTNFNKIAVKYSQSGYSFWLNGVKVADGVTACNFQLLDRFTTSDVDGTSPFNGNIKSIQLYKTALTDAECIALTTI
jgi:hypothetical protein